MRATIWKIAHGKLLTNEERNRRNMTSEVLCPRCNLFPETLMHTLWDCEEVQSKHIKPEFWSKFFSLGQYAWLDLNLSNAKIGLVPWEWSSVFGTALWAIWKYRNSVVFSHQSKMGDDLRDYCE